MRERIRAVQIGAFASAGGLLYSRRGSPRCDQPPTATDSHVGKIICSDFRTFLAHFFLWKSSSVVVMRKPPNSNPFKPSTVISVGVIIICKP